jgi:hypothetical protein
MAVHYQDYRLGITSCLKALGRGLAADLRDWGRSFPGTRKLPLFAAA